MGAPCCSGFFKYSSINSKLSEPQMKAKMLPFIERQGMCLGTPMGPSATETPPQPPPCLHQTLPTQFPRQQWSLAMDAQGRQQGSHNIFMSVHDFPLFEKESQVYKYESFSSTQNVCPGFILTHL